MKYENWRKNQMTKKMEKIIRNYWRISKIVAVMFTICNYSMWTEPFSVIKAIAIIVIGSVVTFLAINLLDVFVGLIKTLCQKIHRYFYAKRLLKDFCEQKKEV